MKSNLTVGLLVLANLALLGWLVAGIKQRASLPPLAQVANNGEGSVLAAVSRDTGTHTETGQQARDRTATETPTLFTQVYSPNVAQFAANLRAINCPEETVKDILVAEAHRRFQSQEEALRPKPADHVPWSWSAKLSEPRLLKRHLQAAALAREEAGVLREALGYEVPVSLPHYAMTTSDQQFEDTITALPSEKRIAARQAHENYWTAVSALLQRNKGLWLTEDIAELYRLKAERKQALQPLLTAQ